MSLNACLVCCAAGLPACVSQRTACVAGLHARVGELQGRQEVDHEPRSCEGSLARPCDCFVCARARPWCDVLCARAPAPAGEDIEKRAELERKFRELCDREAQLMAEIAALRQATAAAV